MKRSLRPAGANQKPDATVGREVVGILQSTLPQLWPQAVFAPDFVERMGCFADLLARWGEAFNLTSRPADPNALAFHIVDCASLLALKDAAEILRGRLGSGERVADIGSGCGFPGVVLASGCAARLVLFERRRKRAAFLRIVIAELGLKNAEVLAVSLPSEQARACFDIAVGRAAAAPEQFYNLAYSVLFKDGIAILYATRAQEGNAIGAEALGFIPRQTLVYRLPHFRSEKKRGSGKDGGDFLRDRMLVAWQKVC
jgi:16S rRNA (guanine527-N7)-methyltransferase